MMVKASSKGFSIFATNGISQDFCWWDFDRVVENEKAKQSKKKGPRECLIIFQYFSSNGFVLNIHHMFNIRAFFYVEK
jgi:hypothetical protein